MVRPIGMKVCRTVEVCPERFSPPLVAITLGVTKCGVKKGVWVDHFWPLRHRFFCQLAVNISKTERYMSIIYSLT